MAELWAGGLQVSASENDASAFGNWLIDLHRDGVVMRLLKDRSQQRIPHNEVLDYLLLKLIWCRHKEKVVLHSDRLRWEDSPS